MAEIPRRLVTCAIKRQARSHGRPDRRNYSVRFHLNIKLPMIFRVVRVLSPHGIKFRWNCAAASAIARPRTNSPWHIIVRAVVVRAGWQPIADFDQVVRPARAGCDRLIYRRLPHEPRVDRPLRDGHAVHDLRRYPRPDRRDKIELISVSRSATIGPLSSLRTATSHRNCIKYGRIVIVRVLATIDPTQVLRCCAFSETGPDRAMA